MKCYKGSEQGDNLFVIPGYKVFIWDNTFNKYCVKLISYGICDNLAILKQYDVDLTDLITRSYAGIVLTQLKSKCE